MPIFRVVRQLPTVPNLITLRKGSLRTISAIQRPTPKFLYQWQEGVEQLEGYQPGGYHPTHIGDRFHEGRYEIVHKLGYGSYSTVWLARDEKEDRNVALKILVAEASKTSSESKILRALQAGRSDHPGRPYVSSLLEDFSFVGPNGQHLCLVTEAAGCSVALSKDASTTWLFPVNVARAISAEVLLGLDYIHSCNVVHGDLHSNNILFQPPGLESSTVEEIYRRFGEPQRLPVQRLDGAKIGLEVPSYCVPPAILAISSEDVTDARVKISDFGEAFFANEKGHQTLNTPIMLLPPELFFHAPLGPAVDVWTLGCTLYEILGERPLFEGFMPDEDDIIAEMISTLGPIPQEWWEKWKKKTDFFLEDGSWKQDTQRNHDPKSRPLVQRLKEMGRGEDPETCEFSVEEMESLKVLLRSMLIYDPVGRIRVCDAVCSEWMRKWGLPAIGKVGSSIDRN